MLSHHELATLMSLGGGDDYLDPFDLDVQALRQYRLVEVAGQNVSRNPFEATVKLTGYGRQFLERMRLVSRVTRGSATGNVSIGQGSGKSRTSHLDQRRSRPQCGVARGWPRRSQTSSSLQRTRSDTSPLRHLLPSARPLPGELP